jgi:uncharacterized OsmC-like protein
MSSRDVCCTINYRKVKETMDRWRRVLRSGGTAAGLPDTASADEASAPVEALCRKVDESVSEATFPLLPGDFVIRCDEQAEPIYYGKGSAPQPLDIFLAGIGMCMASIYGEGAADLGVALDAVEVRVRGDLDLKGLLDFDEKGYQGRPGFSKIAYTVSLQSREPPERIRALIARVERCCPAHNTVQRGTAAEFAYRLNGEELPA